MLIIITFKYAWVIDLIINYYNMNVIFAVIFYLKYFFLFVCFAFHRSVKNVFLFYIYYSNGFWFDILFKYAKNLLTNPNNSYSLWFSFYLKILKAF